MKMFYHELFYNNYGSWFDISMFFAQYDVNWASEASPTLGCSIEISRDIYICIYVGMSRMSN